MLLHMGWSEPSPHDCTSSVWDELNFIPIIGSATGTKVGSLFFPPFTYFKATHKKNLFDCPSISNPNYVPDFATTYLYPTKNPKPCHHSNLIV